MVVVGRACVDGTETPALPPYKTKHSCQDETGFLLAGRVQTGGAVVGGIEVGPAPE